MPIVSGFQLFVRIGKGSLVASRFPFPSVGRGHGPDSILKNLGSVYGEIARFAVFARLSYASAALAAGF